MTQPLHSAFGFIFAVIVLPGLIITAIVSRFVQKDIDVGLGPEPLINNVYHKRVLEKLGYTAETFITRIYFITDEFDRKFMAKSRTGKLKILYYAIQLGQMLYACTHAMKHYRAIYLYFNGGPIGHLPGFCWRLEPFLYRLASVRTVVMPYGSDVQEASRSPNLLFKHALSQDYPGHRGKRGVIEKKIDLWTRWADHVISGVEWVDYMYHWDTLMLGHFSIDTDKIRPHAADEGEFSELSGQLRILHAPNHKNLKGTRFLIDAVHTLQSKGCKIECRLLQGVSNQEVLEEIQKADIIADQFVIGWYAMFALEAMAAGKPVLCYLRDDLIRFYQDAGLLEHEEIPIINCSVSNLVKKIEFLYQNRGELPAIGERSRQFVIKHHSLDAVGAVFSNINHKIGLIVRQ